MVQSINGIVNQKDYTKWNSREDLLYLKQEINNSDSLIISRETYNLNPKFYEKKPCLILNRKTERIENNLFFSKYSADKVKNFITSNNFRKTLLLGGPTINTFFINDDLIDEISITIEPIILNGDINIFENQKIKVLRKFKLKDFKKLNSNTLLIMYSKK
jgi:dihydrofolate reductase